MIAHLRGIKIVLTIIILVAAILGPQNAFASKAAEMDREARAANMVKARSSNATGP